MNASLNDKLRNVKWGEYEVGKLFKFDSSNGIFHAVNLKIFDTQIKGSFPYVVRTSQNNGIKGFIVENKKALNPGNTISFAQDTAEVFYREQPYFTGNKVKIVSFRNKNICLSKSIATFLIPILKSGFRAFSWGSSFETSLLEKVSISLPQTSDGKIDFDFMESFVAELEAERVAELEAERVAELSAYLKVSGLDNYELSSEEKKVINEYEDIKFAEYDVLKIFDVKNTHNILSDDIVDGSGTIPYLCAGAENNSISSYISYKNEYLEKGNCIFIGGKTFIVTYQERDFFSNDSHNLALYVKEINANKLQQLYITTCVKKSLSHKYSWGNSVSKAKIKTDKISLPTKDGKPDYKTMELLISAIQKLVIKDVVQFTNRKLDTYKNIVSKSSFRYQISEQRSLIVASADETCLDY